MLQMKDQSKRLTKQTHETMSYIFKLISDKETSKEGLTKLYQFKTENPDVDVVPFLSGASPCFQKFIEDGLADIERSIQSNTTGSRGNSGGQPSQDNKINEQPNVYSSGHNRIMSSSNTLKDADYYLDKLNSLRVKGNLPSVQTNDYQLMDNKIADENLNMNQIPINTFLHNNQVGFNSILLY